MPAKMIWPIVAEMQEAAVQHADSKPTRNYLGMSEIGSKCPRRLWLKFRGYTPDYYLEGQAAMIFSLGNLVEDEVLKWLQYAGYKITDTQKSFSDINGLFQGHCDGVVEGVGEDPYILEIKSANKQRFQAFQEKGVQAICREYYAQVQCYMGYSGLNNAQFVIMCKDNCDIYAEVVSYNGAHFEAIKKCARYIIGSPFAPLPLPKNSYECTYCRFAPLCRSSTRPATTQDLDNPTEATQYHHVQMNKTCGTCVFLTPSEDGVMLCSKYNKPLKKWGGWCDQYTYVDYDADKLPF